MSKVTESQMKENAKIEVSDKLAKSFTAYGAEQVGAFTFAIPTMQEGQEVWVEVALTAKQWKETKVSPAYDPFKKAQEWRDETAQKAKEKAQKQAERIAKAERDKIVRASATKGANKKSAEED